MNQSARLILIRYTLLAVFICYLPHFSTAPWWLFLLVSATIAYRFIADFYGFPLLSFWLRLALVLATLLALKQHYPSILSNGFFIGLLLTFIALKIIELHTVRDVKVLVFCNFYLILSALIVTQELWIIAYLFLALAANFTLILKLHAPLASLNQVSRRSLRQLLIAIPLSILLFYTFPRIADPLWKVPANTSGKIGFNDSMRFDSITQLAADDSTALRVRFKNQPLLNGYWRGLILSRYDGKVWSYIENYEDYRLLNSLQPEETPDYEIILEPHQKKWLFYLKSPVASNQVLTFFPNTGLTLPGQTAITARLSYALTVKQAAYQTLSHAVLQQNLTLPAKENPRLLRWSQEQFVKTGKNPEVFVQQLGRYIYEEPFWYSLSVPSLPDGNGMDVFWFDKRKGYCEHYASAVAVILRMSGIPARVIIGYQGGSWNPIARYLNIPQNKAHAWVEYWQEQHGWREFDPVAFIAKTRIDPQILSMNKQESEINANQGWAGSWLLRTRLLLESVQFFTQRWFLFYSQDQQKQLFALTGLGEWTFIVLTTTMLVAVFLFILALHFYYRALQKPRQDEVLLEYRLLQKEFTHFIPLSPADTLRQQCFKLMDKNPQFVNTLLNFLESYDRLRLTKLCVNTKENRKKTVVLFNHLRKFLKNVRDGRS